MQKTKFSNCGLSTDAINQELSQVDPNVIHIEIHLNCNFECETLNGVKKRDISMGG